VAAEGGVYRLVRQLQVWQEAGTPGELLGDAAALLSALTSWASV